MKSTFLVLPISLPKMNVQEGFAIAVEEAKLSYQEGGVPVNIARLLHIPWNLIRINRSELPWYPEMVNY